jgi:transposase InsO family protein
MAAVHKWKKKGEVSGPTLVNITRLSGGRMIGYLSAECLRSAELFLLEQAQKGMRIPGVKQLIVDTVTEEDINGVKRKLIVIRSRERNQIKGMYGPVDLPVLARDHRLSELYVRATHKEGHEGAVATLHRSRRKVWITNGQALADSVRARCTECRLKTKKCMEQRMGPLPNHRVEVGAIFQSVAVDLSGPIEYQGTVNKRQVGKGWGVVFVCTTTSAVHIEFVDNYSTDSFLMALRRFMCLRGTPSRFQSDRGEQLVAAAKQVSSWDFEEVIQWTGKKGIKWILVPTGGQHFNGQAERLIGLIKKQIWRSFEGRKYSHEETITILQEAAQVINSRPLGGWAATPGPRASRYALRT